MIGRIALGRVLLGHERRVEVGPDLFLRREAVSCLEIRRPVRYRPAEHIDRRCGALARLIEDKAGLERVPGQVGPGPIAPRFAYFWLRLIVERSLPCDDIEYA